ncbi:MAG: MFS transporter [Chloroflexi bacterium]|nr:MFS transporter [Chloroflexota bacterium]
MGDVRRGVRRCACHLRAHLGPAVGPRGHPSPADWSRLLAVGAVSALTSTANGGIQTFLPLVATLSLGLSSSAAGILATLFTLTTAFLLIPMGRLGDRFGRQRTLILGLGCFAVGLATIGLAGSVLILAAAVALAGIGRAISQPARVALLSDAMPTGRQGTAMGLIGLFEDVGSGSGAAIGGLLWTAWGRSITYAGYGCFLLAAIAVCLIFVRERAWTLQEAHP